MNWPPGSFSRRLTVALSILVGFLVATSGFFLIKEHRKVLRETAAQTAAASSRESRPLISLVLFSSLGAAGLTFLLALLMTHKLTASLREATRAARQAAEGDLNARAPIDSEDEVGELAAAFNRMAENVQRVVLKLRLEKGEVEAVLGSMVEHVIAVDSQGKVLLLNPAAETLFQSRREEAVGKPFLEISRQAAANELLQSVLQTRTEKFEEIRLFLPEERFYEARAVPLSGHSGEWGTLLVLHDITRIQRLEQLRKEFVANVSHELRTPLTSIQGFAETLLSGALQDPKHNRDFVESIQSQSERLTHIVEDLLDLSAIESGRRRPVLSAVSIPGLLRELAANFKTLAAKQDVQIQVELPEDFPPVEADPYQLQQVFTNLLDNAIKFNRRGGRVKVAARTEDRSAVFSISDTGIGIPSEALPRIFERFYRVDKARSRELGGTGLGLAIVKHIVEAHRGSIRAESSPDQGTTFRITLPLASA